MGPRARPLLSVGARPHWASLSDGSPSGDGDNWFSFSPFLAASRKKTHDVNMSMSPSSRVQMNEKVACVPVLCWGVNFGHKGAAGLASIHPASCSFVPWVPCPRASLGPSEAKWPPRPCKAFLSPQCSKRRADDVAAGDAHSKGWLRPCSPQFEQRAAV